MSLCPDPPEMDDYIIERLPDYLSPEERVWLEKGQDMYATLAALLDWASLMGGWEAKVWQDARNLVSDIRKRLHRAEKEDT